MDQLYFWKNWHPQSRLFYYCLLLLLTVVLIWYGVSYFRSPAPVIRWELISDFEEVPVEADHFKVGLFDFSYTANNFVVSENYRGSNIQVNVWAAYAFLLLIAISWVVLVMIISTFKRFWFYFGILLLVGMMVSFKFEQLLLFGEANKYGLLIALALYLPLTYYFQSIRPGVGLLARLAAFAAATLAFALIIALFSKAEDPALVLLTHGFAVPVALSIFFIFLLGHTVISFFLIIVTRNNTPDSKNSIIHFSALSVIYLSNVFLLYLRNSGLINWDLLYLNAFLILCFAAFIGIWEFRMREVQYQQIVAFNPLGAYLYIVLAIITFATCSFFFATANDPAMEAIEDAVVFSQMGYGLLFFLYIIANFIGPLMENKQVYRVMYKPATFPYGTAQIVGTIAVVAFFMNADMFPFHQAVAGYYNGIGDLHLYHGDRFVAEQYYKLGDQYGYNNHRSNYSLGTLARIQNDETLTPYYFREALTKNPSPYASANLSNALSQHDQFFDALFNLRRGLQQFPHNAYLENNLALIYGKTSVIDSALYYLQAARKNKDTREAAEANVLSVIARFPQKLDFSVDTLLQETVSGRDYIQNQINTLLLLNQHPQDSVSQLKFDWKIPEDSVLTSFSFSYLYNYLFHHRFQIDTVRLHDVAILLDKPENSRFLEPLSFGLALAYYATNRVVDAFKMLDKLQSLDPFKTGYYNNILGLWALQQQAPGNAAAYFAKAAQSSYEDAAFRRAVSLTEAAATRQAVQWEEVSTIWQGLASDTAGVASGVSQVADDMLKMLDEDSLSQYIQQEDDAFRYLVLRYRIRDLSPQLIQTIFASFSDNNYKALALHDLLMRYPDLDLEMDWMDQQVALLKSGQDTLTPLGRDYLAWIQILQMQQTGDFQAMKGQLQQLPDISLWHRYKKEFFRGKLAEIAKDSAAAQKSYHYLMSNPFYAEGFLAALSFLHPREGDFQSYQLLLDAIQTNPDSPLLLKAYIRGSILNGLENYAEEAMQDLKTLVSPEEYQQFLKTYQQLLQEHQPEF